MNNPTQTENPIDNSVDNSQTAPMSPLRCLSGAFISGGLGFALYLLTVSIAQTFAAKPIASNSTFAQNIAVAVRTLVVGMSALGTGIFGIVTIGLIALAIQLIFQQLTKQKPPANNQP